MKVKYTAENSLGCEKGKIYKAKRFKDMAKEEKINSICNVSEFKNYKEDAVFVEPILGGKVWLLLLDKEYEAVEEGLK